MNAPKKIGRRVFLKTIALVCSLATVPSTVWAYFIDRFPVRTVEKDNFRFDAKAGLVVYSGKKKVPYALQVNGLVRNEKSFSFEELLSLPSVTQISDFHCVEGWSVADIQWTGFRFEEILNRIEPLDGADFVVFHALGSTPGKPGGLGHYRETLPLQDLMDPEQQCLLALEMDGALLSHDHGAPLRLVSPYDLGYKSIKYITRIEFAGSMQPGWWTLANPRYKAVAPVPEHRLRQGDEE